MSQFCGAHRAPRAGIDVIDGPDGPELALAAVRLAMTLPVRAETIVLVLDHDHRGRTIIVVDDTVDDDAVVDVVERLAEAVADAMPAGQPPGALVVASIRPERGLSTFDGERWLAASDLADRVGVDLLEWFVVTSDGASFEAWCPRDLVAEPPRWRTR